ncbi:MAG: hypothetical protein ACYCZS_06390 [Thiobacillus sp.]
MAQAIREFESHRFRQTAGFSDMGAARIAKTHPEKPGKKILRLPRQAGVFCRAAHT